MADFMFADEEGDWPTEAFDAWRLADGAPLFESVPDRCPHCGEWPIYIEVDYTTDSAGRNHANRIVYAHGYGAAPVPDPRRADGGTYVRRTCVILRASLTLRL